VPTISAEDEVVALSGTQYRLRAHGYEAVVASVGASLRTLHDAHGDLVAPYAADRMRPAMSGALLAPWPNRTADGRYEIDGVTHQLPVNEPDRDNAAHGLVAWQQFALVRRGEEDLTLTATIEAQPGYPWRVRLEVFFGLDERGLTQRVTATNLSREQAPFGAGGHPYVAAGPLAPSSVDAWSLELPADEVLRVSPDRLLPVGLEKVDDGDGTLDFRTPRLITGTVLNHAFTGLHRDADGFAHVRVTNPDGYGVEVLCGRTCGWVQLYTADAADPGDRRHALAVEPMTCPPDALNSKNDLIMIEPGASFSAEWRVARIAPC
jgi:aldose 1-epimerase